MQHKTANTIHELYDVLKYRFNDENFIKLALTHKSCGKNHNERLEFLGDAVINLLISSNLYVLFPTENEGELSLFRSYLVRGTTLSTIAIKLELGKFIQLGHSEEITGGREKPSILANCLESIIGALYLDSGIDKCGKIVMTWFQELLQNIKLEEIKDAKSRLQELLQSKKMNMPVYNVVDTNGKSHEKIFTVSCFLEDLNILAESTSSTINKAEQDAASMCLLQIEKNNE